ncbi:MAG TPA: hypothetical protein VK918_07240 [Pyrinomonadaceae bacterium]|nr:hypothetical protein [Pyrinomonadaceae bacterium]
MKTRIFALFLLLAISIGTADAQRAEVTLTLNEHFFDTVIGSLLESGPPPEFSIGALNGTSDGPEFINAKYASTTSAVCPDSIRLQRQVEGVNTAVRFREGKIWAPLAFTGNYNPPLVGCVAFSGWAQTNIDLVFDEANQRLTAYARVSNVSMAGTGGVGSAVIARMVQSSIDRKINPIEIFKLDKLSFQLPVQNSGELRMRAVGIRHEIAEGALRIHVAYEFTRG